MNAPADPVEARAAALAEAGDVMAVRFLASLARIRELSAEVERLQGMVDRLADRVAGQSELLSRRAEASADPQPA